MSVLYKASRPLIAFNVQNKQHRSWYAEFVKYNTWSRCPARFLTDEQYGDLISFINAKMLEYYVNKEFNNSNSKNKAKSPLSSVRPRNTVQAQKSRA